MILYKFPLLLSLLILLLFQAGIFFVTLQFWRYLKAHKGYLFWFIGIGSSFFAYLLIFLEAGLIEKLSTLTILSTCAATCFALSQAMQVLLFQSLKSERNLKRIIYFVFIFSLVYVLIFEYARQSTDFVFRGVLTSIFYVISDVLSLYLLWGLRQSKELGWSGRLYFPAVAIFGNLFCSIIRATFLIYSSLLSLATDAGLSLGFFVLTQVFATLTFVGISYYWVEHLGIANRRLLIETNEYRELMLAKQQTLNQLLLTQKSTMLGAYAHLVAHEVNQPLAALQINADFLKALLLSKSDLAKENGLVDSMIVEILRASSIIKSIKGLLTHDKNGPSYFSLDTLVMEASQLLHNKLIKNNIELNLSLNAATIIYADRNEIELVMMNLLENAIFALTSISNKMLRNGPRQSHFQGQIKLMTYFEGKNVVLRVVDNGPGVAKEFRKTLFELHNTSKEGGTGMGLWISSFIAKRHNGVLIYDDSYIKGASFSLVFPLIRKQEDLLLL